MQLDICLKFRPYIVGLLALSPSAADACIDIAPFVVEDIRQADVVFTGTLSDYEVKEGPKRYSLNKYGLLTFHVDGVLKGEIERDVQIYWWNSTFNMPEKMDLGERMIVAVVSSDKSLPLRRASAYVIGSMRPDLLQVLQAPCSASFTFPYNVDTEVNLRAVLAGGDPGDYDYFRQAENRLEITRADLAEQREWRRSSILFSLFGLMLLGIMAVWVMRLRKRLSAKRERL
jgi:hypothetical protein